MRHMNTLAYRFPRDKEISRIPGLASRLLHFDLSEELRQLRKKVSWHRGSGRSSKTLAKYPDFHIVLILMKANTRMEKHHVDARISIHAIEGKIRVRLPEGAVEVSAGELLAIDYGIPHEVAALAESAFLITISWPGGTKQERHAWSDGVS